MDAQGDEGKAKAIWESQNKLIVKKAKGEGDCQDRES